MYRLKIGQSRQTNDIMTHLKLIHYKNIFSTLYVPSLWHVLILWLVVCAYIGTNHSVCQRWDLCPYSYFRISGSCSRYLYKELLIKRPHFVTRWLWTASVLFTLREIVLYMVSFPCDDVSHVVCICIPQGSSLDRRALYMYYLPLGGLVFLMSMRRTLMPHVFWGEPVSFIFHDLLPWIFLIPSRPWVPSSKQLLAWLILFGDFPSCLPLLAWGSHSMCLVVVSISS